MYSDLVDLGDAAMAQTAKQVRFKLKTLRRLAPEYRRRHQFEGNTPARRLLFGKVDRAHAASPQDFQNAVATDDTTDSNHLLGGGHERSVAATGVHPVRAAFVLRQQLLDLRAYRRRGIAKPSCARSSIEFEAFFEQLAHDLPVVL